MGQLVKVVAVLIVLAGVLGGAAFFLLGDSGGDSRSNALSGVDVDDPDSVPDAIDVDRPGDTGASRTEVESAPVMETGDADTAEAVAEYVPRSAFLAGRVIDETGAPVVGAEVEYGRHPGAFFVGTQPEIKPESTSTTGPNGRFRLENISRVRGLSLRISHPEYIALNRSDLHLSERGMDLGTMSMSRGAVVSGTVFGPGGKAMAGAKVSFSIDPNSFGEDGMFGIMGFEMMSGGSEVETDDSGRFRLGGLPPAKGTVVAKHDGLADARSDLMELSVENESFGVVLNMSPGLSIHGQVRNEAGDPVAGAKVFWTSPRRNFFMMQRGDEDDHPRTDAAGRFVLEGLNPGTYRVSAQADGYTSTTMQGVRSGEADPIVLTLTLAGTVTVRVQDAKDGASISGATFTANSRGRDFFSGVHSGGNIDEDMVSVENDGTYVIRGLEAGNYTLNVTAPGYSNKRSGEFDIEPGMRAEGLLVEMDPAALLAGVVLDADTREPVANARVSARVVTEREPEGEFVEMRVSSAGMAVSHRVRTRQSDKTDQDGRFELDGLSGGTYQILVQHPDYAAAALQDLEVTQGQRQQELEFQLTQGGALEGVVMKLDGTPSSGDTVRITSGTIPGVTQSGTTDGTGYYRIDHVAPGDYVAKRQAPQESHGRGISFFRSDSDDGDKGKPFTMEEGLVVRIDFSEADKPYLHGKVTSAGGPVEGARVNLYPLDGDEPHFAFNSAGNSITDETGYYKIADMAPGTYRVDVMHPEAVLPTRGQVDLNDATPVTQDFFLEGGIVSGRILGVDGRGLADATVRLEKVSGDAGGGGFSQMVFLSNEGGGSFMHSVGSGGSARTDEDGNFRVEWVPNGEYKLVGNHPAHIEARTESFKIEDHGEVEGLELGLAQAGTLIVKATIKETGRPAMQKFIQVRSEEDHSGHNIRMTDEEGIARFDGLAPGAWVVESPSFFGEEEREPHDVTIDAGRETHLTVEF